MDTINQLNLQRCAINMYSWLTRTIRGQDCENAVTLIHCAMPGLCLGFIWLQSVVGLYCITLPRPAKWRGVLCFLLLSPQWCCKQLIEVTDKASSRAFSWLKLPTSAFTFKTLVRHYAKRALTPRSLNVKLGPRHKSHKGRAGWLA